MRKDGVDTGALSASAGARLEKAAGEIGLGLPPYVKPVKPKSPGDRRLDAVEARLAALERRVAKLG